MITALIALCTLIIGAGGGYFARQVIDKLNIIIETRQEEREALEVGVVTPVATRTKVTAGQPIDLSSDTGGIRKPTPAEAEQQRQIERDRVMAGNQQ